MLETANYYNNIFINNILESMKTKEVNATKGGAVANKKIELEIVKVIENPMTECETLDEREKSIGDPDSNRSTVSMQIEDFYDKAKDADFIIYNSSIDGGVQSVQELLDKCSVLKDFKAVKEGNVWCTTNDMYQQSMSIGCLIRDMHNMLQGKSEDTMQYLFHLNERKNGRRV